ncbi:MAG: FGGY family carbohydrate kinase, partial [Thiohalobacterales bacterium]|nr:FGGY family carbohydrate kinase [Thiohalobacterales bacterium]
MTGDGILAIDQGTHSTRAIVFDRHGELLAMARRPVTLTTHSHTEIEQSATEIVTGMHSVIEEVLSDPAVKK